MKKTVNRLLLLLTILLPWHSFIISGFLRRYISFIILWKEAAVLMVLLLSFFTIKNKANGVKLFIMVYTMTLLTIHLLFNSVGLEAIYSYRIYVFPILLAIALIRLDEIIDWEYLAKWFITGAVVMAVFSIIQQFFIGDKLYLSAGYPTSSYSEDKLHFVFYIGYGLLQRGTGGFIAPIPYSFYLILSLILLYGYSYLFTKRTAVIFNAILVLSLIFTFTRSSLAAYLLFFLLPRSRFNFKRIAGIILLMIPLIFIVPTPLRESTIETFSIFFNNISKLTDPSSAGHFNSLTSGLEMAWNNLYSGIGLGRVGPHISTYLGDALVIESSFLSVIIELGLFTAIFVFLSIPSVFYKRNALSPVVLLIYFAVSFLLPLIYYVELTLLTMIALAGLNKLVTENNGYEMGSLDKQMLYGKEK